MKSKSITKPFLYFGIVTVLLTCGCNLMDKGEEESNPLTIGCSSQIDTNGSDPLFQYQWHLKNNGQKTFSSTEGKPGQDVNLSRTWEEGCTGNGVVIAIVDTGLEIDHEDLKANVVKNGSWDFIDNDTNPTDTLGFMGDHGTSVAGLAAAQGWNGVGGRGVAPRASLKGFNLLASYLTFLTGNEIAALGGSTDRPNAADVDIFNLSYGSLLFDDYRVDPIYEKQLAWGTSNLRNGKGALYVVSSGNFLSGFYLFGCSDVSGLPCYSANLNPNNTLPFIILVGAVNADGLKSSYSVPGSNLWISAPGGEFGVNEAWMSKMFGSGVNVDDVEEYYFQPAILTTDQSGCANGYSPNHLANQFNDATHDENQNCNYTASFNGTSSSAPIVSGAIALLLELNPNLTWRDVKFILASTASQVDATFDAIEVPLVGGNYMAEPGWITNAADFTFHNWYGFGRIDVDAAIELATTYDVSMDSLTDSGWIDGVPMNLSIPDFSVEGVEDTINVLAALTVEAVQVRVKVTHSYSGDIGIELTSPSGTVSIPLGINNNFGSTEDLNNIVLMSNAYYGEISQGDWKIKIVDGRNEDSGFLVSWGIRIYGH